jgi:hypothetical protein
VLLLSAEDSLPRTIRPRLDAAGADCSRVHCFDAVRAADGAERPPVLPYDLEAAADKIARLGVVLIIIDPLMAFLSADYDAHKDQDVRRCLRPLSRLAEKLDVCILLLRHLNKLAAGPALYRGGGSIGIIGAARSALVLGRDPDDETARVLAANKTNLGPMPRSLAFTLEPAGGGVTRLAWRGECDLTAQDILWHGQAQAAAAAAPDRIEAAVVFIREQLAAGPLDAAELASRCHAARIADSTARRARTVLGCVASRVGGIAGQGHWAVALPGPDDSLQSPPDETGPYGPDRTH